MIKHDWLKLQNEFVQGDWVSISDFLRDKKINNNSRSRMHTSGWKQARLEYQKKLIAQTQQKTIESEIDIRIRQQRAARLLQLKGLKHLQGAEIETIDEARKLIALGVEVERKALGFDTPSANTKYINHTKHSKTELDKSIEKASYEELLTIIALVKQEREKRVARVIDE